MYKLFARAEDGAVTVDWVVLTAALVGLGVAITAFLWNSMTTTSGSLHRQIENHSIKTVFEEEV